MDVCTSAEVPPPMGLLPTDVREAGQVVPIAEIWLSCSFCEQLHVAPDGRLRICRSAATNELQPADVVKQDKASQWVRM
jgi:hypothetical protein